MLSPLLGIRPDSGPDRHPATDILVQVCLGPAQLGLEAAISAVPRNEHRFRPGSDRAGLVCQRRRMSWLNTGAPRAGGCSEIAHSGYVIIHHEPPPPTTAIMVVQRCITFATVSPRCPPMGLVLSQAATVGVRYPHPLQPIRRTVAAWAGASCRGFFRKIDYRSGRGQSGAASEEPRAPTSCMRSSRFRVSSASRR